jgi:uridine kinase
MKFSELIKCLAKHLIDVERTHPVRVAIDGVDASGKTMLADALAVPIQNVGKSVIRASIDGFHNPKKTRYMRGVDSPEGYYYDSFNYDALCSALLEPLGQNGNLKYQKAKFDFQKDSPIFSPTCNAEPNAILLFDGVFLLRPELIGYWDFTIFVMADFDVVIERASVRDKYLFGSEEKVREKYSKRYMPGQRIYLQEVQPIKKANIVVDNNDFNNPEIRIDTHEKSMA